MVGLARVREGRRGHGDLKPAQHVVEAPDPPHAGARLLAKRQVQRDAHEHLLRGLQRHVVVAAYHVALQQQVEAGVVQKVVAAGVDPRGRELYLVARVALKYVRPVQPLVREVAELAIEAVDAAGALLPAKAPRRHKRQQPARYARPLRRLGARELHGGPHQGVRPPVRPHGRLREAGELRRERGERVGRGEGRAALARGRVPGAGERELADRPPRGPELGAAMAVQDVRLRGVVVAPLHQGALHEVLDGLDVLRVVRAQARLHRRKQRLERAGVLCRAVAHLRERLSHGGADLAPVVGLDPSVSLRYHRRVPICQRAVPARPLVSHMGRRPATNAIKQVAIKVAQVVAWSHLHTACCVCEVRDDACGGGGRHVGAQPAGASGPGRPSSMGCHGLGPSRPGYCFGYS